MSAVRNIYILRIINNEKKAAVARGIVSRRKYRDARHMREIVVVNVCNVCKALCILKYESREKRAIEENK